MSAAEERALRHWHCGQSQSAPRWRFVLEAAGFDPLRALEIERMCLDEETATYHGRLWWDRWWAERSARLSAQRPSQPAVAAPSATNPLLERRRYRLTPDGKLISVEAA